MIIKVLKIEGMTCMHCVQAVAKTLENIQLITGSYTKYICCSM